MCENVHGTTTRALSRQAHAPATQILRACAVEVHMDDVERHECTVNSHELAGHARAPQRSKHTFFSITIRTPSVSTLFGEKQSLGQLLPKIFKNQFQPSYVPTLLYNIKINLLGHFCPRCFQNKFQPSYVPILLYKIKTNLLGNFCPRFSKSSFNLHMSPHFSITSKSTSWATFVQNVPKINFNLHMSPYFSIKSKLTSWATFAQYFQTSISTFICPHTSL